MLENAWDALAVALANLVAALDPDVIILGGPPAEAGEGFCQPLRERLAMLCGSWRSVPDDITRRTWRRARRSLAHVYYHLIGGTLGDGIIAWVGRVLFGAQMWLVAVEMP